MLDIRDDSNTVHVSLHNVSTKPVPRPQSSLKIDAGSSRPIPDSRAIERCDDGGTIKPVGTEVPHREAGAVYRDALPTGDTGERSTDSKLASGVCLTDVFNFPDLLDQSGKHSTLTQRVDRHHVFAKLGASHQRKAREPFSKVAGRSVERAERIFAKRDR